MLQPPSKPSPNVTSLAPSLEEQDLANLTPPPMAPPKPPSTSSTSSSSLPISPIPTDVPEHPNFSPPQPPMERQHKSQKTPPPKPIRFSSIPSFDTPPQTPVPPHPVQTPTLSTFNPQNTAKPHDIPKPSGLGGYDDCETRPKQRLLMEDSQSLNSVSVPSQIDGNSPPVVPQSKPVYKNNYDTQDLKENLQANMPVQSPVPEANQDGETVKRLAKQELQKPSLTSDELLSQLHKQHNTQDSLEIDHSKDQESPWQSRKFSPMLDRKLRNLKNNETNGTRDAASPLALLMAAKEREKHKSIPSEDNKVKKNDESHAGIHPRSRSPNSFIVNPVSSSTSPTSQVGLKERPKYVTPTEDTEISTTPGRSKSTTLIKDEVTPNSPVPSGTTAVTSPRGSNATVNKQDVEAKSKLAQPKDNREEVIMPLLPPPPEFANTDYLDEFMEPPPTILPPDPPRKKAPNVNPISPPKSKPPPPPPKLPVPDTDIKPKPTFQPKPKTPPNQLPSQLSPSQVTLLSILQKKMLEMDHKIVPMKDPEPNSDDWGTPFSDEDTKVSVISKVPPQYKFYSAQHKTPSLDMHELEGKVNTKHQETSSTKGTKSNETQSRHQYGMTLTVRPGTQNPITVVRKGESS
ncbi:proline-rich extensin-like protein EPR1 [Thalassophryne amazonica]|uniref:proline-rich extensin-like protein EPR1 n=1 Tax=Thalassophryne amazonica TaxID=390379 RepID=UPI00147199DA|nr:proline-rich extensin-like protein EPR1 [Thalassophryne amazonica]